MKIGREQAKVAIENFQRALEEDGEITIVGGWKKAKGGMNKTLKQENDILKTKMAFNKFISGSNIFDDTHRWISAVNFKLGRLSRKEAIEEHIILGMKACYPNNYYKSYEQIARELNMKPGSVRKSVKNGGIFDRVKITKWKWKWILK